MVRKNKLKMRRSPAGSSPGTVAPHVAGESTRIEILAFDDKEIFETRDATLETIQSTLGRYQTTWVNIIGFKDVDLIKQVAGVFELHSLAVEDTFNLYQRPKAEPYEQQVYVVANMLHDAREFVFRSEQISFFIGTNYLLTFEERQGDCLDPVRERVRRKLGRIRSSGPDYLFYALIDTIIDRYFPIVESCHQMVERFENEVMGESNKHILKEIYEFKAHLDSMHTIIWNHKELINFLVRHEEKQFRDETRIYLRDCHDHTMQLLEFLKTFRDQCGGLIRLDLALESRRSNEVNKFLTIVAAVFLPLTFITGLYGMNFNTAISTYNMPELNWNFGYPFALSLMICSGLSMLWFFRHKGWFSWRSALRKESRWMR